MGNTKKELSCPFQFRDGWTCQTSVLIGEENKELSAINRSDGEYHKHGNVLVGYWKGLIYTASGTAAEQSALSLGAFYQER